CGDWLDHALGRPRIEKQRARAAGDHIVHRARHLFTSSPYHLGSDVWKRRIKFCGKRRVTCSESLNGLRIAAIYPERTKIVDLLAVSVDVQIACYAGFLIEPPEGD